MENEQQAALAELESLMMLSFIGATVRKDTGYPGFQGSFAIGIRADDQTTWWRAVFTDRGFTEFVDKRPENVDAWLLLDPEQARGMMTGEIKELAPETLVGDRNLIKRFVSRYLRKKGGVAVRASATSRIKKQR